MSLEIKPVITATLTHRKASSGCCGAGLAAAPDGFTCRECGQPCERILGDPHEVKAAARG